MKYWYNMKYATTHMYLENIMQRKKPTTKGHILYDIICITIQNRQIHTDRKQICRCQELEGEGMRRNSFMGMEFSFEVMKNF